MAVSAVLWLCVCVGLMAVCTDACQYLNLNEGEVCKNINGTSWTCTHIKNCTTAIENIKYRQEYPEICGLKDLEVIACCKPERKSKQMCRKYADSVFIRLPDPLYEGGVAVYDTCFSPKPRTTRAKRVVNGTDVITRQFPHMALIGYGNDTTRWSCLGSLISELYVLTRATCAVFGKAPTWVRLGDHDIKSEKDEDESWSQPTEYEIVEVIIHPEFRKETYMYDDVAVLKLNTSVYFTEFIRPICLQTEHELPYTYGLVTGWGKNKHDQSIADAVGTLQTANITILSSEKCNNFLRKPFNQQFHFTVLDDRMVCAETNGSAQSASQGDGGGPLQVPLDDPYCMYSQVGITNTRIRTNETAISIFTRVSFYVSWIESIVWP